MQSLVIASKREEVKEEYKKKICADHHIDRLDIYNVEAEKGAIGIEEIRTLQKKLFLKPIKSPTKAVVIKNAENLTIEAQNALLKSLEEPPENTIIILTISNKDLLLPTILSRCKIIEPKEENAHRLPKNEISQYLNILISLRACGIGERLKLAQDTGKTKEETLLWLETMILAVRQELAANLNEANQSSSISQSLNLLISFQKSYTVLKTTNANPRFTLETLFLSF